MRESRRDQVTAAGARTLAWVGGTLYDVAAGWRSIPLDGSTGTTRFMGYGKQFDAVTVSPRGDFVALTSSTGTKGLLLAADGRVIREVDRSYYHAEVYRYPLVLFTLPDGRTAIAHCPTDYNRLEIEDVLTGACLTDSAGREPDDVFHSRLAVSASGRYLLSAGWLWHPWSCVMVYDLHRALTQPDALDSPDDGLNPQRLPGAEVSGACFVDDDVVVSTSSESDEPVESDELAPTMLARWSITTGTILWHRKLDQTAGDLVSIAGNILALHQYPRLYDANNGELLAEWPDLPTGDADSSIVWDKPFSGSARVAVDHVNRRFAVTDGDHVTVIHLDE
ncbi:hypothetical protein F0L68_12575 [Solihabitans fulvus]|uniref:PQQ-like domain-containing protein n=1 Tax=Solihabitans fulvus TaxID=1892852 RepID=A0A5B2XIU6_9PSEU|nr:hypothetical protein [Solihabitans fulvus]KAA2262720.1 hypothetical protein F0L68_12575 [Solihabitans fulvus]